MKPSKQVKWQRKMVEEGRCKICGKPRSDGNQRLCEFHRKQKNVHNLTYRLNNKKGLTN